MITKEVTITRRSRVGFAYNSSPEIDYNKGGYYYPQPEQPEKIGTIKTVLNQIKNDNNYQAMRNNTFYSVAWFVKDGGEWYKIPTDEAGEIIDLILEMPKYSYNKKKYFVDSVKLVCNKEA